MVVISDISFSRGSIVAKADLSLFDSPSKEEVDRLVSTAVATDPDVKLSADNFKAIAINSDG